MILDSPRESHRYLEALTALLCSDHEQKLLYTLTDCLAIGRMLNILDLVSVACRCFPSAQNGILIPKILQPEGVTGGQFKT